MFILYFFYTILCFRLKRFQQFLNLPTCLLSPSGHVSICYFHCSYVLFKPLTLLVGFCRQIIWQQSTTIANFHWICYSNTRIVTQLHKAQLLQKLIVASNYRIKLYNVSKHFWSHAIIWNFAILQLWQWEFSPMQWCSTSLAMHLVFIVSHMTVVCLAKSFLWNTLPLCNSIMGCWHRTCSHCLQLASCYPAGMLWIVQIDRKKVTYFVLDLWECESWCL